MGHRGEGARTGDRSPDADRFRTLYTRHLRAITAYFARRVPADRIDDAVSETFLVAWRRIADVPDDEATLLWLYRVAHHVVGHEYRSVGRRRRLGLRLAGRREPSAASPDDMAIDSDDSVRVLDAVGRLNATDGELLRLVAWEHLSATQIAEVLQITPNAVHQRLHRAKQHLMSEFDRLGATPSARMTLERGAQ